MLIGFSSVWIEMRIMIVWIAKNVVKSIDGSKNTN